MTNKVYSVLEMEVIASDRKTPVQVRFTRSGEGSVEIVMTGKFKTVELTSAEANVLSHFLSTGTSGVEAAFASTGTTLIAEGKWVGGGTGG